MLLYDSSYCRLCAEKNENGTQLFDSQDNGNDLSELINKYLPIKVNDDGKMPKTICPGCNIQLDSTVQFFQLIISGQIILRTLFRAEVEKQKKAIQNESQNDSLIPKLENGIFYSEDHGMSLLVEGLQKPRRKRGRPPKKLQVSPPEEIPPQEKPEEPESPPDLSGKRRRKAPLRFKEAVQGKELDRIFREEGVIDDESETDSVQLDDADETKTKNIPVAVVPPIRTEVIGLMETTDGKSLGRLVIMNKGKGRGRPRGKVSLTKQTCDICNRQFNSVGRYMAHLALHTNVIYECRQCCVKYDTKLELLNHQETTKHTGQNITDTNSTLMPIVEAPMDTPADTTAIETHSMEPDTTTKVGDETRSEQRTDADISDNNVFNSLIAQSEPTEPKAENTTGSKPVLQFECTFGNCNKSFNSKQACEVHLKAAHLGHRPFSCTECKATFPYQSSLKQHMLTHSRRSDRGYACDLCGKVLNHPSSVVYHKIAEHNDGHRYVCLKCGKSFKHRQLLQRHQLVHSDVRPFVCKVCNATFKTKANLVNHQPLHSGIKRFQCEICKNLFAHKTSLTLHMRWHSGQKPYQCRYCSKAFSQKGNLSEHIRIHTGDKPFVCTICSHRFTTSSQHRLHLQRHRGDRPYKCEICGKRFLSKESWSAHCRRHRGDRPHECNVCSRKFSERWSLLKHLRSHTGERPYTCEICSRAFADPSNLLKHKKIHGICLLRTNKVPTGTKPEIAQSTENISEVASPNVENDGQVILYMQQYNDEYQDKDGVPIYQIFENKGDRKIYTIGNEGSVILIDDEQLKAASTELNDVTDAPDNSGSITEILDKNTENAIDDSESAPEEPLPVTDQDGNPIHYNMPDGTQVPITSTDGGKTLQITFDGQVIPLQISGGDFQIQERIEDDDALKPTMTFNEDEITDENVEGIQMMADTHTVRLLPSFDDNAFAQYYTIV